MAAAGSFVLLNVLLVYDYDSLMTQCVNSDETESLIKKRCVRSACQHLKKQSLLTPNRPTDSLLRDLFLQKVKYSHNGAASSLVVTFAASPHTPPRLLRSSWTSNQSIRPSNQVSKLKDFQ